MAATLLSGNCGVELLSWIFSEEFHCQIAINISFNLRRLSGK